MKRESSRAVYCETEISSVELDFACFLFERICDIILRYVSEGLKTGFLLRDDCLNNWGNADRQDTTIAGMANNGVSKGLKILTRQILTRRRNYEGGKG